MPALTCYSSFDHPRLRYAFDMIFDRQLGCGYRLTHDPEAYASSPGPCLNYSRQRLREDECFLPAGPLLGAEGIAPQQIELGEHEGIPMFFAQRVDRADLPFDLPALVFYLLSRYEEYLPFAADAHGRFPATAGLAMAGGFLDRPLVDEWCAWLARHLQWRFPRLALSSHAFEVMCTYDIDHAWAYRHRPLWQAAGGLAKAAAMGRWPDIRDRIGVWRGQRQDPFDTFDYLDQLHREWKLPRRYFFLLPGLRRGPDRTIPPHHPALRALIRSIGRAYPVGIHPSYRSFVQPERIGAELETLRKLTGLAVKHSRQHYLRFRLPDTYRHLIAAGIEHDHSMGYADGVGFRASTARPFAWYDLGREQTTPLLIHPFQVMDGTLKDYLNLRPEEALQTLQPLIERTRAQGGRFVSLWHNSSFGRPFGWSGWKPVYEKLLAELAGQLVAARQQE